MLTFGSLFSGIGGADLGFEHAGMVCRWQVEIDGYCIAVLAKHWPHVERHRDIHHVGAHNLAPVDVVWASPPCQPHSLAGLRRGADDDRNLWPETLRVVAELRPRWFVGENVPGIVGTVLNDVAAHLESLGYEVGILDIPASAVGAPHPRQRIYIVAYTHSGVGGLHGDQRKGQTALQLRSDADHDGPVISDLDGNRRRNGAHQPQPVAGGGRSAYVGEVAADAHGTGCPQQRLAESAAAQHAAPERHNWWSVEPNVVRVVHGFPGRVDRIRALGNAVVPQVAELIGRLIVATDAKEISPT